MLVKINDDSEGFEKAVKLIISRSYKNTAAGAIKELILKHEWDRKREKEKDNKIDSLERELSRKEQELKQVTQAINVLSRYA